MQFETFVAEEEMLWGVRSKPDMLALQFVTLQLCCLPAVLFSPSAPAASI
jgi:hypothetical protein